MIADTIGMFEDIDGTFRLIHQHCAPSTRIIISYYSHLWEPILKLAELFKLKSRQPEINYIATVDFLNLMDLALSRRLAAVEDGVVCVSEAEGDLSAVIPASCFRTLRNDGRPNRSDSYLLGSRRDDRNL